MRCHRQYRHQGGRHAHGIRHHHGHNKRNIIIDITAVNKNSIANTSILQLSSPWRGLQHANASGSITI
jgi:hypothetical protein